MSHMFNCAFWWKFSNWVNWTISLSFSIPSMCVGDQGVLEGGPSFLSQSNCNGTFEVPACNFSKLGANQFCHCRRNEVVFRRKQVASQSLLLRLTFCRSLLYLFVSHNHIFISLFCETYKNHKWFQLSIRRCCSLEILQFGNLI